MTSLFDIETPASGFRLLYLEVFNWGTFDSKIWRITPDGKSSLLTGGNGSGKTTIADALVTLMVPPQKRYYNQSSGTEKRKERNENTYVLGAYKTLKGENELAAKTKHLRTKDDFSILLAVFYNKDADEHMTLAQVRWYSNNDLKKTFIISAKALEIQTHFYPMDTGGKWRKRLKDEFRAEFHDSFAQYSRRFIKGFGLRSDKALSLFSQTVGIKDIENLNRFIRTHMLEETNVEDHFRKLRDNYDNLLMAHQAIEKAKVQLDLLDPIASIGDDFKTADESVRKIDQLKEILPIYFAHIEISLLDEATRKLKQTLTQEQEQIQAIDRKLTDLEDEKESLVTAIGQNGAALELKRIQSEIGHLESERDKRKETFERYSNTAKYLGFPHTPDRKVFLETRDKITGLLKKNTDAQNRQRQRDKELYAVLSQTRKHFEEKIEELTFLRKRKSNIPPEFQKIRDWIAERLGIDPSELPFAGELMSVKSSETAWERGIEAALRDLGLSLLVRQPYVEKLDSLLNTTRLHGRITYIKVNEKQSPGVFDTIHSESIVKEISIKSNTPFYKWLENYFSVNFHYILTDHLESFNRHKKAVMQSGLTKSSARFEKKDLPEYADAGGYILGWDNQEKISLLEKQARHLEAEIKTLEQDISACTKQIQSLEAEHKALTKLAEFIRFQDIDITSVTIEIQELKVKKEKLLADSDQLKALENQLAEIKVSIFKIRTEKEKLIGQISLNNDRLRTYAEKTRRHQAILAQSEQISIEDMKQDLEPYADPAVPVRLDTFDQLKNKLISEIDNAFHQENKRKSTLEKNLVRSMLQFRNPEEDIRKRFPDWTVETVNLRTDAAYLQEYLSFHKRIKQEDLPAHKRKFKKYLNEQVIFDIANFKTTLESQVEDIRKSIQQINLSLAEIDYSTHPPTYIELLEMRETDNRIRQFIEMLKKAIPDAVKVQRGDEQELEFAFNRIKEVIEILSQDPENRRYITDVRNWLKFSAVEKYRADGAQAHYYEDSQSLSGGEKAKLAYTILASALAYQFGISSRRFNVRSLRFVVVDEAFSKVDPENSVYAMELFNRLNLQVMLITPLDKINLAERYIHSVHYVENKNQHVSSVFNLTMAEYEKEKQNR